MKSATEIERKFLVREAILRDAENLRLVETSAIYLDLVKCKDAIGLAEDVGPTTEIRVSKHERKDEPDDFRLTRKDGGPVLSRQETIIPIDENRYEQLVVDYGKYAISKKRFKFTYIRKEFELDVFPALKSMLLEVELEDEAQLFTLPPFVDIIKEVTGDPSYYGANMAKRATELALKALQEGSTR